MRKTCAFVVRLFTMCKNKPTAPPAKNRIAQNPKPQNHPKRPAGIRKSKFSVVKKSQSKPALRPQNAPYPPFCQDFPARHPLKSAIFWGFWITQPVGFAVLLGLTRFWSPHFWKLRFSNLMGNLMPPRPATHTLKIDVKFERRLNLATRRVQTERYLPTILKADKKRRYPLIISAYRVDAGGNFPPTPPFAKYH